MKALQRYGSAKEQRERQGELVAAAEYIIYAMATILYDRYGFGAIRLGRITAELVPLVNEYIARHDKAAMTAKMKKECHDRGINFVER